MSTSQHVNNIAYQPGQPSHVNGSVGSPSHGYYQPPVNKAPFSTGQHQPAQPYSPQHPPPLGHYSSGAEQPYSSHHHSIHPQTQFSDSATGSTRGSHSTALTHPVALSASSASNNAQINASSSYNHQYYYAPNVPNNNIPPAQNSEIHRYNGDLAPNTNMVRCPAPAQEPNNSQANVAPRQTQAVTHQHASLYSNPPKSAGYATKPPQPQYNQLAPSSYQHGAYSQPMQQQYHQGNGIPPGGSVTQSWSNLWSQESVNLLTERNIISLARAHPPPCMTSNVEGNCSRDVMRCTLTKMPENAALLQKSRLPLGIIIHPFKEDTENSSQISGNRSELSNSIPVISESPIVRCRACRTYLNPFARVIDHRRWQCNVCLRYNDFPEEMLYSNGTGTDVLSQRPDLQCGSVEYIASVEYMVRPPQPATYLFLFDVSRHGYAINYIPSLAAILSETLDDIPGDSRSQIGFIAFDSRLHFFTFSDSQVIHTIAPDVNDVFLPSPNQILVTIDDHRDLISDLLNNQLVSEFSGPGAEVYDTGSALGPALQAAYRILSPIGGRVTLVQCTLPSRGPEGEGSILKPREDPNQRANPEVANLTALLNPSSDFYKKLSLDCSEHQIAIDIFALSPYYMDLATVGSVAKYSGGSIYYYGAVSSALSSSGTGSATTQSSNMINLARFESDLQRYLTRNIGFEAVMRLRCSRGLSIHTFHGNFFVRSTDLLALPNINPDSAYGMQISIDDDLKELTQVCFQAAILYTSPWGERRIRVHTLVLPTASTLPEVINSADGDAIVGLLCKMAVDRTLSSSLSDAREALINAVVDSLQVYRNTNPSGTCAGLVAPQTCALLPLYVCALLKHPALRIEISTRIEDRTYAMERFKTLPLHHLMTFIYPNLYPIHNLASEEEIAGNAGSESPEPVFPEALQLSFASIERHGAYLLDTYDHLYLYICKSISPAWLTNVFGGRVNSWDSIPDEGDTPPPKDALVHLPELDNAISRRLRLLLNWLISERGTAPQFHVLREDSRLRSSFLQYMLDDRNESSLSYYEFLQYIQQQMKN